MLKKVLTAALFLICAFLGFFAFKNLSYANEHPWFSYLGFLVGLGVAALAIFIEKVFRKVPLAVIIGGAFGLFLGLGVARLLSLVFEQLNSSLFSAFLYGLLSVFFGYLGLVLGGKKFQEIKMPDSVSNAVSYVSKKFQRECPKVLDTSAIIDGRLADLCETGWVDGPLIIPSFVLTELQHIADSTDPLKRARGRRGLDTLQRIQDSGKVEVRILEIDYPEIKEIDHKLVELCREIGAKLITTDYNLNKIARLKGVPVLNVNELSMALKPIVTPGEIIRITLVKAGKEKHQGVGYLDDGTMVVVENARDLIGKEVEVVVTSLLQTPAGRIVFGRLKEAQTKKAVA
ncbi:PilT protein domain protein [Thermodesulfatator indicus DSM 15286]|uniref:PilT protein domain protein n=1 Tax=Thermodesulfatator indicus (strain DSM 15286 / JCM 11887 / CIR29812) TaxID=667014 RepID=F8AC08_THEID|nr:PIN domain-containing protein [Thermodesulfatator indicus]AEH45707.1 PilT protein domain protein [Thermodesulfatator indicus DSM 15286]